MHCLLLVDSRHQKATCDTLLCFSRSFEAEVLYVPVEDPTVVMETRERCFSRWDEYLVCAQQPVREENLEMQF